MAEADESEKEHEPSQQRLDEARKRGEIPRSADLTTAAAYGGLLLAAVATGPSGLRAIGQAGAVLLGQADRLAPLMRESGAAPVAVLLSEIGWAVAPFFLFPAGGALAATILQQALVFTPEKLAPKLARISPLSLLTQKFGRGGLVEFGKSVIKLGLVAALLGVFLAARMTTILATLQLDPALATVQLLQLSLEFLVIVFGIAVVIGAVDYIWQRAEYLRRNRMSRQEMMDEYKLSEGDPHTKAQRRQRGQEIAMNRMLQDIPTADVVIVNPRHYAVVLKWARKTGAAPVCVAKGVDEVAARIRARAAESGVPIHRDPPTARALHASVKIGAEIRPEHYRAVAAAIRFAEAMRKKAGAAR